MDGLKLVFNNKYVETKTSILLNQARYNLSFSISQISEKSVQWSDVEFTAWMYCSDRFRQSFSEWRRMHTANAFGGIFFRQAGRDWCERQGTTDANVRGVVTENGQHKQRASDCSGQPTQKPRPESDRGFHNNGFRRQESDHHPGADGNERK